MHNTQAQARLKLYCMSKVLLIITWSNAQVPTLHRFCQRTKETLSNQPHPTASATHLRPQQCGFIWRERWGRVWRQCSGVLLLMVADFQTSCFKVKQKCSPNPLYIFAGLTFKQSPRIIKLMKQALKYIVIVRSQCLAALPIVFQIQLWTCCPALKSLLQCLGDPALCISSSSPSASLGLWLLHALTPILSASPKCSHSHLDLTKNCGKVWKYIGVLGFRFPVVGWKCGNITIPMKSAIADGCEWHTQLPLIALPRMEWSQHVIACVPFLGRAAHVQESPLGLRWHPQVQRHQVICTAGQICSWSVTEQRNTQGMQNSAENMSHAAMRVELKGRYTLRCESWHM